MLSVISYVSEQMGRVETRPLLKDFYTLPNWHLWWIFEIICQPEMHKSTCFPTVFAVVGFYSCFSFWQSGRQQRWNSFADIIFEGCTSLLVCMFSIFTQRRRAALTLCLFYYRSVSFFTSFPALHPPMMVSGMSWFTSWCKRHENTVVIGVGGCHDSLPAAEANRPPWFSEVVLIHFLVLRRVPTSYRNWLKSGFC